MPRPPSPRGTVHEVTLPLESYLANGVSFPAVADDMRRVSVWAVTDGALVVATAHDTPRAEYGPWQWPAEG